MINIFHQTIRSLKISLLATVGIAMCCLSSCSIFNPNPGENEADTFIQKKKYDEAITIIEPLAVQGIPWAQLRLGIAYEYGQGKTQSAAEAVTWYRKVAIQMKSYPWADGVQILSSGDDGYFNQNNDAKVAQYLLARLYYQGGRGIKRDFSEAWRWASYAQKNSWGEDILFCCENSKLKKQFVTQKRLASLLASIEKELPVSELDALKTKQQEWKPENTIY